VTIAAGESQWKLAAFEIYARGFAAAFDFL
jgi:hypothetical protein